MPINNFDAEKLKETRKFAEELIDSQRNSNYSIQVDGYVSEDYVTEQGEIDTRRTALPEWLAGFAVANGVEVLPEEVALVSFQLGKLIGRQGFVEILN
jgi:hypothetical protein